MKNIILIILVSVFVMGCASTTPDIVTLTEKKLVLVSPDPSYMTHISTPTLSDDIVNYSVDEALDAVSIYAIQLQSVIMQYEQRADSLNQWTIKVKDTYETRYPNGVK